jgi:hypothetical protein
MTTASRLFANAKPIILFAITGLVVSFVRIHLQRGRYFLDSLDAQLASWLIHCAGLWIFIAIAGSLVQGFAPFWLGEDREHKSWSWQEACVYISLVVLIGAIFIDLVAGWSPSDDYEN